MEEIQFFVFYSAKFHFFLINPKIYKLQLSIGFVLNAYLECSLKSHLFLNKLRPFHYNLAEEWKTLDV